MVTIGTLTNVALAIKADADFLKRLNHLYIGAGHIHSKLLPKFLCYVPLELFITEIHTKVDTVFFKLNLYPYWDRQIQN